MPETVFLENSGVAIEKMIDPAISVKHFIELKFKQNIEKR